MNTQDFRRVCKEFKYKRVERIAKGYMEISSTFVVPSEFKAEIVAFIRSTKYVYYADFDITMHSMQITEFYEHEYREELLKENITLEDKPHILIQVTMAGKIRRLK